MQGQSQLFNVSHTTPKDCSNNSRHKQLNFYENNKRYIFEKIHKNQIDFQNLSESSSNLRKKRDPNFEGYRDHNDLNLEF